MRHPIIEEIKDKYKNDEDVVYLLDTLSGYVTERKCPKCGQPLLKSDLEDYEYLCIVCDENFYGIEIE